ncbi:MAG: DsbC family protein [Betaproteobacteria bacterium]|nr:DsbC family protein [Betaproteobacteria bacterium]
MQKPKRSAIFQAFAAALAALTLCLTAGNGQALAQEAQIKRTIEGRYGVKVEGVTRTPYAGLYEVVVAGDERSIIYADEKASFLFSGQVVDIRTRRNRTQERLDKLAVIKFDELPLDIAIRQVRGNGRRVVAMFSDPYCGFCKQLDQQLVKMDDVTIYTFLYPILRKEESPEISARIWCAPDRAKAYIDLMVHNRQPPKVAGCTAPVDKWLALGEKLNVRATPVSYVASGARIVGARFDELQRAMDEASKGP